MIVTGHVAINPDQIALVAADNRTRANHRYKFRAIRASSSSTVSKILLISVENRKKISCAWIFNAPLSGLPQNFVTMMGLKNQ